MKKIIALLIGTILVLGLLAGCGGSGTPEAQEAPTAPASAPAEAAPAAEEVTWDDYIDWLASAIGANSPDPDGFRALLAEAQSWEDVDPASPPWDKIFDEAAFDASTWDEFVAAGGIGTYNAEYEDSASSGEPTGEPTDEPAA